ncbi:MAG: tRNA (adenosine(37)-N6)-threonylcarbamoyltransferase complex ATPase subunit type 1 TsaE [Pseudomonadota bacterium]
MASAPILVVHSEEEMNAAARRLAPLLTPGRPLLLTGPIGAGKSHLARGLIQAMLGRNEDVPSPTYTIVQTYIAKDFEIWHADLYRISDSSEIIELGLDEALAEAAVIIEWPDRLPRELVPSSAIHIEIQPIGDTREVRVSGQVIADILQVLGADV